METEIEQEITGKRIARKILIGFLILLPGILIAWYGWHSLKSAHGTPGVIFGGLYFYAGLGYIALVVVVFLLRELISGWRRRKSKSGD
jgi:membrane protein implicated in regulation of membrane protease activity